MRELSEVVIQGDANQNIEGEGDAQRNNILGDAYVYISVQQELKQVLIKTII